MPTNDRERDVAAIPVKRGRTGPARRRPADTAADVAPPEPEELDARQERMNVRRRGPEVPPGQSDAMADLAPPEVPPTDADDE